MLSVVANNASVVSYENLCLSDNYVICTHRVDGSLVATRIEVENDGHQDDDDDGDDHGNEDFEAKAQIDSLGTDFLIVADTRIFVNGDTRIRSDHHNELAFSDLQVGMRVEVHARRRDDGSLLATKIKVED